MIFVMLAIHSINTKVGLTLAGWLMLWFSSVMNLWRAI